jgi:2-polyprenyl-6-hydroxyphenyl methylase/3-demethylubiquinone-9 3-methyltransferase
LAANQLGADVTSFDLDPDSVTCTRAVKDRFRPDATNWNVIQGSLTDREFLSSLGEFDFIYCWGVAHHTGSMWRAIDNLLPLVKLGGSMVLAIYNDQLYVSRIWRGIKRIYHRLPRFIRPLYVASIGALIFLKRLAVTLLACCLRLITLRNPFTPIANWVRETQSRGMHGWYDLVDWVGGWPFEVAKVEEVFRFMRDRGFSLQELTTCIGHGCNEYVFIRMNNNPA